MIMDDAIEIIPFQNLSEPVRVKVITAVKLLGSGGSGTVNFLEIDSSVLKEETKLINNQDVDGLFSDWITYRDTEFEGFIVFGFQTNISEYNNDIIEIKVPSDAFISNDNYTEGYKMSLLQNCGEDGLHLFTYIIIPQFTIKESKFKLGIINHAGNDNVNIRIKKLYTYEQRN